MTLLDDGVNVGTRTAPAVSPPTTSNTKPEIVAWLNARGVDVTVDELTKPELLDLVDDLVNG